MGVWHEWRRRSDGSFWHTGGYDSPSDVTPDGVRRLAEILGVSEGTLVSWISNGINNGAIARWRSIKPQSPQEVFGSYLGRIASDPERLRKAWQVWDSAGGDYAEACRALGLSVDPGPSDFGVKVYL